MSEPVYYTTSRAKLWMKPCPFCGSVDVSARSAGGTMRVICKKCLVWGPLSDIVDPRDGDAIIAWNKREGDE